MSADTHRRPILPLLALLAATAITVVGCASPGPEVSREMVSPDQAALASADKQPAKPCPELGPGYVSHFEGTGDEKAKGKLYLVLLDDKAEPSIRAGRSLWALTKPLTYTPSNGADSITVPPGFVTDLASIPRFAWVILPPDGPWAKAAVIHDFLYYTHGTGVWRGRPPSMTRTGVYSRAEADWILRDAMRDRCVGVIDRNIIYLSVRLGGGAGWGH